MLRKFYYSNGSLAYAITDSSLTYSNILSPEGSVIGANLGNTYCTYFKDAQGSTSCIVNSGNAVAAAYIYGDFGETTELTNSNAANEICYTGALYDRSTKLYYLNARYYDPEIGRFISQDTYRGELEDVDQWHLYAYCANNPINYIDPSGHSAIGKKLNLADYRIIHNKVADLVAWSIATWWGFREVYCKGKKGRGFLDVYDVNNNEYYEVKSKKASTKKSTKRQMAKYDVAHTFYNKNKVKRCKEYVEGSFYYGVWKVCYSKSKAGLVAYNCIFDESRYKTLKGLTVTAIAVLAITTVASGGAAIPYYVLAI